MIIRKKKQDKKTRFVTYLTREEVAFINSQVRKTGITESQIIAMIVRDKMRSEKFDNFTQEGLNINDKNEVRND